MRRFSDIIERRRTIALPSIAPVKRLLTIDLLVALLYLLFGLLFYHALALQGRILMDFDSFTYFYPNESYAARSLQAGHIPLWNPYLWAGAPFLANIQTALFYPPNLLFVFMSVPQAYAVLLVFHAWLGAFSMYALGRSMLWLDRPAALIAGLAFGFSGFITAQAGHLNQMQAAALLPLALLLVNVTLVKRSMLAGLLAALVIALQLLAGHTQEWYLSMVVLAAFVAYTLVIQFGAVLLARIGCGPLKGDELCLSEDDPGLNQILHQVHTPTKSRQMRRGLLALAVGGGFFAAMLVLALLLAAVQLLPTLELQGLSIRSSGLTYQEASSFSLLPSELLRGLLPLWGDEHPESNEWIGYAGIIPLALAALAVVVRPRNRFTIFFALLAFASLFLALGEWNPFYPFFYKLIPGLNLFRVPARWLLVWTLGLAGLAGIGASVFMTGLGLADRFKRLRMVQLRLVALAALAGLGIAFVWYTLHTTPPFAQLIIPHSPTRVIWAVVGVFAAGIVLLGIAWTPNRVLSWCLVVAVALELGSAGQTLPVNRITNLPEAYSSLRSAPAFLLTQPQPYRVLSITNNTFDPGDLPELRKLLTGTLPSEAVYEYIVAAKSKETLAPNVPLLYGIPSIDGYDGGVLPLRRYVEFKQLLVPPDRNTPDGRLREQLTKIPPQNLLALFGVDYVLMDKIADPWVDGVYYDLGLTQDLNAANPRVTLPSLPRFDSTSIGVISYLSGTNTVEDGTTVATLNITDMNGRMASYPLRAGMETAEGHYAKGTTAHKQAKVAAPWSGDPQGSNYIGLIKLPAPSYPLSITLQSNLPAGADFVLRGMSLIDDRLPASESVSIIPEMRVVHSGDVKIYERSGTGRAFLVPAVQVVDDDDAAIRALGSPSFNPESRAIVTKQDLPPTVAAQMNAEGLLSGGSALPQSPVGTVQIRSYQPERVILHVQNTAPAVLVLNDTFYPGWKAQVDGHDATAWRVNYLYRGLDLPAGSHEVVYTYDPPMFNLGAQISAFSLFLLLLGLLYELGRWLNRRRRYETKRLRSVPTQPQPNIPV